MKKILLGLIFCTNVWANIPWTAKQAKQEAEMVIGSIIEGQKLLKYAIQAKDKSGWERLVVRDFDKLLDAFREQRFIQANKNVKPYEDCESALLAYKFYSETFFQPDSMMMLQSRDVNNDDFKRYFVACKKAVDWKGP